MSFKKEHPDYLSYTSNLFYLNELPNNFQSAFEGFLLRYGNNAQQLKFLINKMGTVILKESTSNWGYDYLLNDLKDYTYDLCNKEFSKVMDYISLLYEQSIMTQEEINDFLEEQNIGYLISYSSLGSSWVLREEIDNISESTNLAINEVLDICKQTLSHLEQAKNNIANNHNARARKDSIRDCLSAMESLLKNITNTNDIKLATKSLRASNEYGPDIIVKDGFPKDFKIETTDERFIIKAQNIIEKNIDDLNFNTRQFEEEMGMSHSVIYRKIKKLTSLSANEYIREYKIKRAAQIMLQDSNLTLAELSLLVGFNDHKYFGQCFKKIIGCTFSEYAKKHN